MQKSIVSLVVAAVLSLSLLAALAAPAFAEAPFDNGMEARSSLVFKEGQAYGDIRAITVSWFELAPLRNGDVKQGYVLMKKQAHLSFRGQVYWTKCQKKGGELLGCAYYIERRRDGGENLIHIFSFGLTGAKVLGLTYAQDS